MSARTAVVSRLSFKVGFPFSESELSPSLRRKIGELETLKVKIDSTLNVISTRQNELTQILATEDKLSTMLFGRRQLELRVEEKNREILSLNSSLATLHVAMNTKVEGLSNEIFSELATRHESGERHTPAGPSLQVVKETVKEVVMVPCMYCRGLMPQTSISCPNCGAKRKA